MTAPNPSWVSSEEIETLLRRDPLADAERITGRSYKDDDRTSRLGLGMHLDHSRRKREALRSTDDTHLSMSFADTLRIYTEMGFSEVLRDAFCGRDSAGAPGQSETYVVLWHDDGLLATAESYGGDRLNTARVYYNWLPNDGIDLWSYISSGGLRDGFWIGDHDAREGIRHNLSKLRTGGVFLPRWVEQPFLWLLTYTDSKVPGYDYRGITAERISRLPSHVQTAIGASS